jgi:hypothetical protein
MPEELSSDVVNELITVGSAPSPDPVDVGGIKVSGSAAAALGRKPAVSDEMRALMEERASSPLTIDWYGLKLHIEPQIKWGMRAALAERRGDDLGMLIAVFGEDQLIAMTEAEHFTPAALEELMLAIQQYYDPSGK